MNYNNNNEYLFWKIFKNKFLLNKIIEHIHNTEWVIYDDHSQLHMNNRIKFKDIHSLEWMIKNKQYNLLNYKLDKNDYIYIDKDSIITLFKELSIQNVIKNNNNNNNQNNNILLKELIIKILEKKRDEFEIIDLTKAAAIWGNSIEVLRILVNEPYSITIYPSTLEMAIQHSHPSMVEEILKLSTNSIISSNSEIFKNIEKKSLILASKNKNYQIEMIEFILLNFKSPLYDDIEEEQPKKKKFKSTSTESLPPLSIISLPPNTILLKSNDFLKIKSDKVKRILYENDLVSSLIYISKVVDLPSFDELLYTFLIYFKIKNNDEINKYSNLSQKQLESLFITKLKKEEKIETLKEYQSYIIKYGEIINEYDDDEPEKEEQENEQLKKFKKFIKIYNLMELNFLRVLDNQDILNHDNCGSKLEWNEILIELIIKKQVLINDKSTIDWLLNCTNNYSINLFICNHFSKFIFSTIELVDYLYINQSNKLNNLFNSILKKFDSKSNYNESIIKCILHSNQPHSTSPNKEETIIKLVNYFNEIESLNDIEILKLIINQIIKLENPHYSDLKEIIKIDIINKISNQDISNILIQELGKMNLKFLEILILNSNLFNNEIEFKFYNLELFYNLPKIIYDNKCKIYHFEEGIVTRIEIIELIKKILLKLKEINYYSGGSITMIVNYFFEKLISIKGITINEIKSIYEIIKNQYSIRIHHSIYHTFWYLHIRDIKFTFYILSRPDITEILKESFETYYDCSKFYNSENQDDTFDLFNYLDASILTYDSIIGSGSNLKFDEIIELLIKQLSHTRIKSFSQDTYQNIFQKEVNKDLEYCLIIKRNDLFFKQLEFIKIQLEIENQKSEKTQNYSNKFEFPKVSFLYDSPSTTLLPTSSSSSSSSSIWFQDTTTTTTTRRSSEKFEKFKNLEISPYNLYKVNTFFFDENVMVLICNLLNLDEIIKVIKFNFYQSSFQYQILFESIYSNKFEIVKFILNNFNIILDSLNSMPLQSSKYHYQLEAEFILNHYFKQQQQQQVQYPCNFKFIQFQIQFKLFKFKFLHLLENYFNFKKNQLQFQQFTCTDSNSNNSSEIKLKILNEIILKLYKDAQNDGDQDDDDELIDSNLIKSQFKIIKKLYKLDEYQELFKNSFNYLLSIIQNEQNSSCCCCNCSNVVIKQQPHICNYYNNNEDNIFLEAFILGDIKLCELILYYYNSNYQFKLTKLSITKTIKNQKINIIKYFLKNHYTMFENHDLINHLKFELNKHRDYKYLNIL